MAISFLQKIRLVLHVWRRRREERDKNFVQRNLSWVQPPAAKAEPPSKQNAPARVIDMEGLQVAFLDDSGRIAHYLDVQTGDITEIREGEADVTDPVRYKRVPRRSGDSDAADRRRFAASLDPSPLRDRLATAANAMDFRRALSADRAAERSWYVFKNDAATAAIEAWLKEIGLR
ncbi:MAG: hypothetical protein ACXV7D_16510 [Thermoanaerobaculia bacterium]